MIWLLLVSCLADTPKAKETDAPGVDDERKDPIEDSALVTLGYYGEADLSAGWLGIETAVVQRVLGGAVLCAWQYESVGSPSTAAPCVDPDGGACDFAFDVALTGGQLMQGDCGSFGNLGAEAGPYSYGYIEDYSAGGASYGPSLLFYYAYHAEWLAVPGEATWDVASSQFTYRWDLY